MRWTLYPNRRYFRRTWFRNLTITLFIDGFSLFWKQFIVFRLIYSKIAVYNIWNGQKFETLCQRQHWWIKSLMVKKSQPYCLYNKNTYRIRVKLLAHQCSERDYTKIRRQLFYATNHITLYAYITHSSRYFSFLFLFFLHFFSVFENSSDIRAGLFLEESSEMFFYPSG